MSTRFTMYLKVCMAYSWNLYMFLQVCVYVCVSVREVAGEVMRSITVFLLFFSVCNSAPLS